MPIYALGEYEPQIHESAFVHPDAVVIGRVSIGPEARTAWSGTTRTWRAAWSRTAA